MCGAVREPITGDATRFNFNPPNIIDALKLGDIISIDFNSALVQVAEEDEKPVFASAFSVAVFVGQKQGCHGFSVKIYLPPLTAKDIAVIDIAKSYRYRQVYGIRDFALSFANSAEDVETLRARVGRDARIISKKLNAAPASGNLERDRGGIRRTSDRPRRPFP